MIQESDSPWGSPVVLVKKKNTHRLCVDMRKVNSVTKPTFFPLPLLEDVFQTVAENNPSSFSLLDLTSGFWQIKLDESSKPKTALVTLWKLPIQAHATWFARCSRHLPKFDV